MAEKKKKKSRIKKFLKRAAKAALIGGALYGGSKLWAGRNKGTASNNPVGGVDQIAADAVTGTNYPGANKVVADTAAPISKNIYRSRHRLTDSAGNTIPKNHMANIAAMNAPKGIFPPGSVPMPLRAGNLRGFNRKDGGRIGAKKGGSVKKARATGIAKRGFGRALMKGKK